MLLASASLVEKVSDHAWPGCQVQLGGIKLTLMSNTLAAMVLAAVIVLAAVLPLARRRQKVPTGGSNVLEVIVLFIRDMVARPALHDQADRFLPYLLTLFIFILSVNLLGILPLEPLTAAIPHMPKIGGVATSVPVVCGTLAAVTLMSIVVVGLHRQAVKCREHNGWPMWLCAALAPAIWAKKLVPHMPGAIGIILFVPMMLLEIVGVLAKCFALMIRLFANMLSGHILLAVIMMILMTSLEGRFEAAKVLTIGPICVLASVAMNVMELLVAGLQAYIFTFLSAIFIGLYMDPGH
jgi:F-type H+-transporting ATPase subunit a